jgi:phage gp29-like protein
MDGMRTALDSVLADAEVQHVLGKLVNDACEIAWQDRVSELVECVEAARSHVAAVEARSLSERLAWFHRAVEADELRTKLEIELWDLARQLKERKR